MDIKQLPIDQTGLSVRAINVLHRNNIHTIGEMLAQTKESLQGMRNMGGITVREILDKNDELRSTLRAAESETPPTDAKDKMIARLKQQGQTIDELELLSAKSYNILRINGLTELYRLVGLNWEDLMLLPRMDSESANEILLMCRRYQQDLEQHAEAESISVEELFRSAQYRDAILRYARENDVNTEDTGLSNRAVNQMKRKGLDKLSDWIFLTERELAGINSLGQKSITEILAWREEYLERHGERLMAFCLGDQSALLSEEAIREKILGAYREVGFGGFSLSELRAFLKFPESLKDETLKKIIGGLLAAGELEYVDFRCYRVYTSFFDYLDQDGTVDERSKEFLRRRLQGDTLDVIAQDHDLTRERVRQVVIKTFGKLQKQIQRETGQAVFDEDYYRYLFENYALDRRDAEQWLGIPASVWNYMLMTDAVSGKKSLDSALEDTKLDAGLRLKIKNYLNRNKIFVDDTWLEKRRGDIEKYVVGKYCRDEVPFDEFARLYNSFLEEQEVPFDESIYYTEAVLRTRKNRLTEADYLLWKYGEMLRAYDIPGRDFDELLETLNLDGYQNTEISTAILMREHPEIMEQYDIRDQYELHNLLKKIVPDGSYHDFHCGRTPNLRFGEFNRDKAIMNLLLEHAPISTGDFVELINQEYGYQPSVILGTYLTPFSEYVTSGVYSIEQKLMPEENMKKLKAALRDDFYYLDEFREIYADLIPGADLAEINGYNLKRMGFQVLSRYAVQNYSSLEAYFRDILTREEILNITAYRNRYTGIMLFSQVLCELKRNREIVEFEPNQIIHIRRLERAGIHKQDLQDFCDQVYAAIEGDESFSAKSLRDSGFYSDLYELGFSDWFYGSILAADPRFSYGRVFTNILLRKGQADISKRSFITERIRAHGSIDIYDLLRELTDRYGCVISDKSRIPYTVQGTEIFYDQILERFYANADLYYREIDEAGGYV